MGHTSVEDILNNVPPEETAPEPTTTEPPAEEGRPRDEHGRFVAKETGEEQPQAVPEAVTEPPAAPPTAEPQQRTAPLAALEDERRKRQAAEERLRTLEAQIRPQPQAQAPAPIPDPVMDPEGYAAYQDDQRYFDRLAISARFARMEHGPEKFEKMKEWGYAKCEADPRFNMLVRQSQDPFSVVNDEYQREQMASELEGVGSIDDLRAKIRAEVEAEIRASIPSTVTAPQTTAGTRSAAPRGGPEWSGPTPLNAILPGR